MNVAKYSANGNDFVLFHSFIKKDRSKLAKEICDRQNGIGADGLIVLVPHEIHEARLRCVVTEAERVHIMHFQMVLQVQR